jgi:type II secretory pathway pseudopilin PulG
MIQRKFTAGFTLFEMLISVAIIIIVSGVVFYNHNQFESDTELTNLAYQIALSVREAQVKSISVRQYGGSFTVPYGIHLSKERPEEYILFADLDGNGIYTSGSSDDMLCTTGSGSECLEKVTLGRDNYIEGWRGILWADDQQQVYGGVNVTEVVDFLDIKFERPDPDALFGTYYEAGSYASKQETLGYCGGDECTGWALCLKSPDEQRKQVIVYNTGQISVEGVGDDPNTVCLQ